MKRWVGLGLSALLLLAGIVGYLIAAVMSPMLAMYQGLDNL